MVCYRMLKLVVFFRFFFKIEREGKWVVVYVIVFTRLDVGYGFFELVG